MAQASKAFNGSDPNARFQSVYAELELVSQSTEHNTSTLRYRVYIKSNTSGYSGFTYAGGYKISGSVATVEGSGQSWTWNYSSSASVKGWTSFTVSHDSEGNLSARSIQAYVYSGGTLGSATVSVSLTVPQILRVSVPTLSKTKADYGTAITTYTNRVSEAFTHRLRVGFNGVVVTVAAGIEDEHTWTIPASWMERIPNASSSVGTVLLDTYYGETLTGTKTIELTATVPASVVPTITTASVTEAVAGIAETIQAYVQNKSKLALEIEASGAYGSTIKSTLMTVNGQSFTTEAATTDLLRTAGNNILTFSATDSRGRTGSLAVNVPVLAYSDPEITAAKISRCDADGTDNPSGAYMLLEYAGSITALGNKNVKNYRYRIKKKTASAWTTYELPKTNYTPSGTAIVAADPASAYNVELLIGDFFADAKYASILPSENVAFHIRKGGTAWGIGQRAEEDGTIATNMDLIVKSDKLDDKYLTQAEYASDQSDIENLFAALPAQFTPISGVRENIYFHSGASGKYSDMGGNFYRQIGKLVIVNLRIQCVSAQTTLTRIGNTILSAPADTEAYVSLPVMDNQTGKALGVNVTADGILQARYGDNGRTYYGQLIYLAA